MNCFEFCKDSSVFKCEIVFQNQIKITGYEGNHNLVSIPKLIDDLPVTAIDAKAFLGQRQIEVIELPEFLVEIGDWAFAHMKNLKKVYFPANEIAIGKQIFQNCEKLEELPICLKKDMDPKSATAISYYGVALFQYMKNQLLFTPHRMGSSEWYQDFDQEVLRFLSRPDGEDFEPVILGWFNDEDYMETQYPSHVATIQGVKARLALMRLRFPVHLVADVKLQYEHYISTHIDDGVWDVLISSTCILDLAYLRVVLALSCIDEDHVDDCMHDLVRQNASEAVVLLMEYKDSHFKKDDFFDGFTL